MPALPPAQAAPPRLPELPHLPRPRSRAAPHRSAVTTDPSPGSFGGETARFYSRYRRAYPVELIELLGNLTEDRELLVDLGCGTGQLALQLARRFKRCVGIDPEADMLREAVRLAAEREIANVEWIEGSADQLPILEEVDLVTIGTAFHFMDPVPTLSALRELTRESGAVAVAYNGSPIWLHADPWAEALRGVLEEWFGPLRDLDVSTEGVHAAEGAMHELAYRDIELWERVYEDEIDADFVVGHIFSALSPGQVEAERQDELARQMRASLPKGHFTECVRVRVVTGRP